MSTKDEEIEMQFTGYFIPKRIVYLFEAKEITAKEMVLLAIIDSHVDDTGGCTASNRWLAKRLGSGEWVVSKAISKLKEMGLLHVTHFDGRIRHMETSYSRVTPFNTEDGDCDG